uniref:Uncharacterized protein n=1 Tax=Arundo donax TaxID=35708 RepID=A0A0A9GTQ5_ARUDO
MSRTACMYTPFPTSWSRKSRKARLCAAMASSLTSMAACRFGDGTRGRKRETEGGVGRGMERRRGWWVWIWG